MEVLAGTISDLVAYDAVTDSFYEPGSMAALEYGEAKEVAQAQIAAGFIVLGVNDTDAGLMLGDIQCFAAPCSQVVRRTDAAHQVPDVNVAVDRPSVWPWLLAAAGLWMISK